MSTPEARAGHGPLVELEHLTKHFPIKQGVFSRAKGVVHAVEDVTLTVNSGETWASSASPVAASRPPRD